MKAEHDNWDNEGGHISAATSRVVHTPGCDMPYKVVLTSQAGDRTDHPFATIREAEEFIRRNTNLPIARSAMFDRPADEGPGQAPRTEVPQ